MGLATSKSVTELLGVIAAYLLCAKPPPARAGRR
jgi:hypothetical protein